MKRLHQLLSFVDYHTLMYCISLSSTNLYHQVPFLCGLPYINVLYFIVEYQFISLSSVLQTFAQNFSVLDVFQYFATYIYLRFILKIFILRHIFILSYALCVIYGFQSYPQIHTTKHSTCLK